MSGQTSQPAGLTEPEISDAIAKAVEFVYSRQNSDGSIRNSYSGEYTGGGEALSAYALITAGQVESDSRLRRTLEYLKSRRPELTYSRSFRAIAFSRLNHAEYRSCLADDAQWLIKKQHDNGGWGYGPASTMSHLRPKWTDASNSQFALLALREASDAGVAVPQRTWMKAESFWRNLQNGDGGWGYQPPIGSEPPQRAGSHGSMTTAGVASYFILADMTGQYRQRRRQGGGNDVANILFDKQIGKGLNWLKANYEIEKNPKYIWMAIPGQLYYYLFCLQRAGESSGMRTIGENDYAEQICRLLLKQQKSGGSWNNSVIDTSFAILSLARASSPIIISRLGSGESQVPDPRDAANITRWISRRTGRAFAWQWISGDFSGATLLYINAIKGGTPSLPDEKIKIFIRNGGTCLIQANPRDAKSVESFQKHFLALFPDYRRQDINTDHPVFNLRFQVPAGDRPKIVGIGDGCRTRIFIIPDDVSGAWQQYPKRKSEPLFALAGNIVLYSGGGNPPPGRFSSAMKQASQPPPAKRFINVARLKYAGDYDVCPLAIDRLSRTLARSLPVALKELPAGDASKQIDPSITLLWLTGNVPPRFSEAELENIRKYLRNGGTLLIDPAIGRSDFYAAAKKIVEDLFGPQAVSPMQPDDGIITGNFADGVGADLRKVRLTRKAGPDTQPGPPQFETVKLNNRLAVVLSAQGLTCGIEGNPCFENIGYITDDARKIALNITLYTASGER